MKTRQSDQPKPRTKRKTAKKSNQNMGRAWRNYDQMRHRKAAAEAKKRSLNRPPEFNEKQNERDRLAQAMAEFAARGGEIEHLEPASAILTMRIERLAGISG